MKKRHIRFNRFGIKFYLSAEHASICYWPEGKSLVIGCGAFWNLSLRLFTAWADWHDRTWSYLYFKDLRKDNP